MKLPLAILQTTSSTSVEDNIEMIGHLIESAAQQGAELITMPEVVNLVQKDKTKSKQAAYLEAEDPFLAYCKKYAQDLNLWIHIGSLVIKLPDEARLANRSYMINNKGEIVTSYDKIHMFDVNLANGESYRESNSFKPGNKACLVDTPWGSIGLTICYDVRFPQLHRHLAEKGAKIIMNPAAFTQTTGEAHWHHLLTSRAIENTCFVVAAAQTGRHQDGRETFGHSLAINPWGEALIDAGTKTGISMVTLDLSEIDTVRKMIPSLENARQFQEIS